MLVQLLACGLATLAGASPPLTARGIITPRNLTLSWEMLPTGSQQQFRGLSAVSDRVAWVSGTGATVLRTVDGGASWESVGPPGLTGDADADAELQFRDVQAFSADRAVILSIGPGAESRVYVTADGGKSWRRTFTNDEPTAFYNCMDFEDNDNDGDGDDDDNSGARGFAVSDPVDGKFRLIETGDGGRSWTVVDPSGMAPALEGEFGFAASGTCISTAAGRWYLATGGVDPGR
ncbi:hypothetical protein CTA2_4522, partial [Colletotrichum tanaceti]